MAALATHHLHRFFRRVSESAAEALMLGGSAAVTPLNQWVIVGLHARQTLCLQGKTLHWTNQGHTQRIDLTDENAHQHLFETLERARQQCQPWPTEKQSLGLPMAGGLAGVLGYEFYRWCDSGWQQAAPPKTADWPELHLFEFEDWLLINLKTAALTVLSNNTQHAATYQQLWQTSLTVTESLSGEPDLNLNATAMADYLDSFQVSFQPQGFTQAVEQLKRDIFNGEVYQANLSLQLQKELSLDPYALFERLCLKNPSPFAGFLKSAESILVCNSPERLVQLDERGRAQTRPIAGTRGRGHTPEEDEAIGQTLLNNEKEQAEHLMLVDLARNDLGRVCQPGSVAVDEFLVLERYSHVTHLVSNVAGQLKTEAKGWDLLRSLFPGGTITGCPKIRCVELLSQLEPVSRGLYTGSLGYLDASTSALDFNILIRSVYLKPLPNPEGTDALRYNVAVHVGAGIVHDAVGPHEYRECLRKANAILNELYRLERQPSPV
jgi:para-aminobenzoate synthetase component 1